MNHYTVRFTGTNPKTLQRTQRVFRVTARDTYVATDILDAKHSLRERFALRTFEFGHVKPLVSRAALRRALNATPECEERS